MIQISIQQLKDFQTCERLYDFRYNEKLPETIGSRTLNTIKFENTIKSIVHYFFYKKQAGITPSYSSLLNRWEKLWFPKDSSSYDIIYEQHETLYGNMASLTTKAASVLMELIENFGDSNLIPIGIDEDFIAPITSRVAVKDKFDLIYFKDGTVHVLKWMFNYKLKYQHTYMVDFSIMNVGYQNKFGNKVHEAKFGYFDLLNQKSYFNEFIVEQGDIEAVKYWCDSIVDEETFPSRRGLTSYCKVCPYDKPCSKWTSWNNKENKDGKARKR